MLKALYKNVKYKHHLYSLYLIAKSDY